MGRTIIDVHILPTVPPSNLNRAEPVRQNRPSMAERGALGFRQACKRAVRMEFERTLDDSALGWRSVRTGEAVAERVMTIAPAFCDQASAMATTVLTAAHLVKDEPKKTHAESPPQRLSAAWAAREGGTR